MNRTVFVAVGKGFAPHLNRPPRPSRTAFFVAGHHRFFLNPSCPHRPHHLNRIVFGDSGEKRTVFYGHHGLQRNHHSHSSIGLPAYDCCLCLVSEYRRSRSRSRPRKKSRVVVSDRKHRHLGTEVNHAVAALFGEAAYSHPGRSRRNRAALSVVVDDRVRHPTTSRNHIVVVG